MAAGIHSALSAWGGETTIAPPRSGSSTASHFSLFIFDFPFLDSFVNGPALNQFIHYRLAELRTHAFCLGAELPIFDVDGERAEAGGFGLPEDRDTALVTDRASSF